MPVDVERGEKGIVTVVLNNPSRRNALNIELFEGLAATWPKLAEDRSIRAVVLTGAGEAFCSGADLSADLISRPGIDDLIDRALLKTALFPKPLVAAINGHCVAGGVELVLAADIRIAREDAKFGLPEVRWGLMPTGGGAMKLIDQIGYVHAMDLLLTGRLFDGREAERMGLVNIACPAEEVMALAYEKAQLIAAASPLAVQATKRTALLRRTAGYAAHEEFERLLVQKVRASGHPRIGMAAFLAKRQPVYDD